MYRFVKFTLDRLCSAILIVLLLPAIFLISLYIKFSDGGSIFFIQPRLGRYGNIFNIVKFRTMIEHADRYLDAEGMPTVSRVTRIGSFLRKTSLDEIPQLFNVLIGDMSFIGPRPALVSHMGKYDDNQMRRLSVRPGISGLAQVSGRNEIPWSKRIELDIQYIENCSLRLDLIIAFKTIVQVFTRKNIVMDRNTSFADDLGGKRE